MAGPSNLPHPESIGRRMWCKHAYEMKGEKEFRNMMHARLVSAWDAIPDAAVHSPSDIPFMISLTATIKIIWSINRKFA
jgi:hypothetical protein